MRSEAARRGREQRAVLVDVAPREVPDRDDTLALLVLCCHPALTPASAIALTLRAVGGLTTAEVARAFLVPETTAAQRISRAKATIRRAGGRFEEPSAEEVPARLRQVLRVIYLLFGEGYAATAGRSAYRAELCCEGIRLARLVVNAVPDHAEATALLSLLLLLDSRRAARVTASGEMVPIDEQDRSAWDVGAIREGLALLDRAIELPGTGEYQLQAAIAALHSRAPSAEETDWRQVLALYGLLEQVAPTPVVTLNRAVATGHVDGPAAGLAVLASVAVQLRGHRVPAVRGHLLELAGDTGGAHASYAEAARLATNLAEQRWFTSKAARLGTR